MSGLGNVRRKLLLEEEKKWFTGFIENANIMMEKIFEGMRLRDK